LVEPLIGELNEWFSIEPSERDAEDALIDTKLNNWEAGFLDAIGVTWPEMATYALDLANDKHQVKWGVPFSH